jgi:lysophospholipase
MDSASPAQRNRALGRALGLAFPTPLHFCQNGGFVQARHGTDTSMKHLSFALLFFMAATGLTHAKSQAPTDIRYDGTRDGFADFADTTGLDWPAPDTIDTFKAGDGASIRYAHWQPADPQSRSGVVVFFSGRTEYIEKNIYTFRDLQQQNYELWTLDWRGQGLSDRAIPEHPDRGHIDTFDTFVADAAQFIDEIVQLDRYDGMPKILMAHSMGGAIGTLYLQAYPGQFDRAVFSAPMHGLGVNNALVRSIFSAKSADSCATTVIGDCPWKSNFKTTFDPCDFSKPATPTMFKSMRRATIYSHDLDKLREQICIVEAERLGEPNIANLGLGKPTAGWMTQAFAAIKKLFAQAGKLQTPLLIIGGGADDVVSNDSQQAFCDAAASYCCRLETEGASHELLIEVESIRTEFMAKFYDFADSDELAPEWCASHSG